MAFSFNSLHGFGTVDPKFWEPEGLWFGASFTLLAVTGEGCEGRKAFGLPEPSPDSPGETKPTNREPSPKLEPRVAKPAKPKPSCDMLHWGPLGTGLGSFSRSQ